MCYTTVTHFNSCSHRTSTTTLCPRSTQQLPTIYHHPQPCCVTNTRDLDFFVCRDQLCDGCIRVNFWLAGGGDWLNSHTGRDESEAWSKAKKKEDKGPAAGGPPRRRHRYSPTQNSRTARWEGHGPDKSMYHPAPTLATLDDGGRCPLSEAFERAVRIEGDVGAISTPADCFWEDEDEYNSIGHSWDRQQKGEYGPSRPPHSPSHVGNRLGGLSSWLGSLGGHSRRTRRCTAGNKKRVRFARKAEVLPFREDWATTTLGSLGREYKSCR